MTKKMQHEEFDIRNPRSHSVRQDRFDCDPERFKVKTNSGQTFRVIDFSPFGIALEQVPESMQQISDGEFQVDGFKVGNLNLRLVRNFNSPSGNKAAAFSIVGEPLDVEAALAVQDLNEIVQNISQQHADQQQIKPEFRLLTLEVKNLLQSLEGAINSLRPSSFSNDLIAVSKFEDSIASRVAHFFQSALTPIYQRLQELTKDIAPEQLPIYFDFFRQILGDLLFQSAYAHRAYFKPRGYAGDFEMMNHVYKRELRGESLFAKCLQRYFVDEPAGKAVRNREAYLRTKIREICRISSAQLPIRLLSVASGPAVEIQKLVSDPEFSIENLEFHLLDQDLDALKHAQRRILEVALPLNRIPKLQLHHRAIKNVIQEGLLDRNYDLIYSAGLFDYFTDPVAVYAAQQLVAGLRPQGRLVIGNFSMKNPNQFAMGLIMDWNLIYRSEEKMKELFSRAGSSYQLEQEDQGINFFAIITK
ncbi:MAG: class I SAM-dependent methyltransferase [Bdellovibrio sp.]